MVGGRTEVAAACAFDRSKPLTLRDLHKRFTGKPKDVVGFAIRGPKSDGQAFPRGFARGFRSGSGRNGAFLEGL